MSSAGQIILSPFRRRSGFGRTVHSIPAHVNCRCFAIEETALTMQTALPPEERYVWSAETYANYQAEQALNRRAPNLVDTLVGRP